MIYLICDNRCKTVIKVSDECTIHKDKTYRCPFCGEVLRRHKTKLNEEQKWNKHKTQT